MPSQTLIFHITGGALGLLAGSLSLFAPKGQILHKVAGTVFFLSMLIMSAAGTVLAYLKPVMISVIGGGLTFYLVLTAWLTVMRPANQTGLSEKAACFIALATGTAGWLFGLEAVNSQSGIKDGFPPFPYFFFGGIAFLGAALDIRMMLNGGVSGKHRLARHLWRMCFALFMAAASFFLGQPELFPAAISLPLRFIPVVLLIVMTVYWLIRVLFSKRFRQKLNTRLSPHRSKLEKRSLQN